MTHEDDETLQAQQPGAPSVEGDAGDEGQDEDDSVLDSVARHIGPVPWWIVSSLFHAIVFTLFILMMTEIPHETTIAMITSTPDDQVKPQVEPIHLPKPVVQTHPVPINLDQPVVPDPVVVIEPVVDPKENQSDNNSESNTSQGKKDNLSNVNYNGYSVVSTMGVSGGGPAGAYGSMDGRGRLRAAKAGGGGTETETAVHLALEWLAKHQEPDGHWDTVKYQAQDSARCDTAATGVALLAFLGAGQTERRGEFRDNVKRAQDWIMKQQRADGCIMPGANGKETSYGPGYFHAICGLALAESFGMSPHNAALHTAAQNAVNYSCDKHEDGTGSERGGWRYSARQPGDISVTGWFIMQLKSARLAKLAVPQEALQGGVNFLDSVEVKGDPNDPYSGNRFKYQPARPSATPMQTLIGCTARMFLGWPKDQLEPAINWAVDKQGLPSWGANGADVNWYYMYYGTVATFQMSNATWKKWNAAMIAMLVPNQRQDGDEKGSWDPTGAYANLGRVWSTANGALCLEVYYRVGSLYKHDAAGH
ncbi:MAG: prenyltransferase/squalene oxidase repeat-containing protein [Planctomycetota bacterium]